MVLNFKPNKSFHYIIMHLSFFFFKDPKMVEFLTHKVTILVLKPSVLYDFEALIKQFIEAYSKIGIKHNTVTQIRSFKKKEKETVLECVDMLWQYIVRCPGLETPSQRAINFVLPRGFER